MLGLMEKKEYRELKGLIVNGFAKVDKDYQELAESVVNGFAKVDKDYQELAEFVGGHISIVVQRELVGVNKKMDEMKSILDDQSKYFQEQEMIRGQLNRHEGWIKDIAVKSDIQLDY